MLRRIKGIDDLLSVLIFISMVFKFEYLGLYIPKYCILITLVISIFFGIKKRKSNLYFNLYLLIMIISGFQNKNFKELMSIIIYSLGYYVYVINVDIKKSFKYYKVFSIIVAITAIFEFFSKITDLNLLLRTRVSGIFSEPTHLGYFLVGNLFFIINKDKRYKTYEKIIIILALIITFSLNVYLASGILLGFNIFFRNANTIKKIYKILPVIALVIITIILEPNANQKMKYFIEFSNKEKLLSTAGLTTFAIYTNYIVMTKILFSIKSIFGVGVGRFEIYYYKYIPEIFPIRYLDLNVKGDVNFFIRLLSETGFIGIFLFLFILLKVFDRKNMIACLGISVFLVITLRNGSFTNGITLFYLFIYLSSINYSKEQIKDYNLYFFNMKN